MLEYQILFPPILNLFARSDDMSEDSDDDIDTVTDTDPESDIIDSTKEAEECPHNEGNFLEKIQVLYLLWKSKKIYLYFYTSCVIKLKFKLSFILCRRRETKKEILC